MLVTVAVNGELVLTPRGVWWLALASALAVGFVFLFVSPFLIWRDFARIQGDSYGLKEGSYVKSRKHGLLIRLQDAATAAFTLTHGACKHPEAAINGESRLKFHLEKILNEGREGKYDVFGRIEPATDWSPVESRTFLTVGNLTKDHLHIGGSNCIHWHDAAIRRSDFANHIARLQREHL